MDSQTMHTPPGNICPNMNSYTLNKHIESVSPSQHSARLKGSHTEQLQVSDLRELTEKRKIKSNQQFQKAARFRKERLVSGFPLGRRNLLGIAIISQQEKAEQLTKT